MRSWLCAAVMLAGCTETPPPACSVTELDPACAPQYQPTFTNVYANTLKMDCGSARGACHSASGEANLSFATEDAAYTNLLAKYVTAGDPACSELIVRTADLGEDYAMPQGDALAASERCALQQWVRAGALR